ncbi:MAG: DNA methylase [Lentisphaerae bacterium]|nr:DNA methylase [Lentisphaerota bacterium]
MTKQRLSLHAICPYFAMFPETFVREHVEAYSKKDDWVFDPFCGRGTTILESLLSGRNAAGSDINPVAFCVSRAKAERPTLDQVTERIAQLKEDYEQTCPDQWKKMRLALPPFFRRAFFASTLSELLFLRAVLKWRTDRAERFIAALILGSLHGEMDRSRAYFSNQMPRTICLKPDYSLRYWRDNELFPKKRRVFDMLRPKAECRLKDLPECHTGKVKMTDARRVSNHFPGLRKQIALVVTSPPYLNVTRYEEDQWLRLWFLGGEPRPTYGKVSKDDRHARASNYWKFIKESWAGLAPLLKDSARIVVRLGAIGLDEDELTRQLKTSVRAVFPRARLVLRPARSEIVGCQAQSFLPSSKGCLFEMDYVFAV